MTRWQKITLVFVAVATVLILSFDALAAYFGGQKATISWLTTMLSGKYPAIAFAWGFLMGHFFGQNS